MSTAEAAREARNSQIVALFHAGETCENIARAMELSRTTVRDIVCKILGDSAWSLRNATPSHRKRNPKKRDKSPTELQRQTDATLWRWVDELCMAKADRYWLLRWEPIPVQLFRDFIDALTRTANEYTHVGGTHWSPSHAELAARLHVPVETVDDWATEGVVEPWEIAVVRAYARTGIVVTVPKKRVSSELVRLALHKGSSLAATSEITGIPLAMLERHVREGAPAGTHGRAYLLMASEEYRQASRQNPYRLCQDRFLEIVTPMLDQGLTYSDIAKAVGLARYSVERRCKQFGLVPSTEKT